LKPDTGNILRSLVRISSGRWNLEEPFCKKKDELGPQSSWKKGKNRKTIERRTMPSRASPLRRLWGIAAISTVSEDRTARQETESEGAPACED